MINPMCLAERTIVVTGGSSGIGRATALLLSRLGARVVIVARNRDRLDATLANLSGTGHRAETIDLTDGDALPGWFKTLALEVGPVHGLVHAAGMHLARPLSMSNESAVSTVFKVNVGAALSLARGFRQRGVCGPKGSIVLVSSVVGLAGQAGVAAYSASKGALIALAKSLALELAREGHRVNCVAPALVKTEMTETLRNSLSADQMDAVVKMHPLGLGEPLDVAHAIAFLLGDAARWITGSTLVVDGGYLAH